MTTPEERNDQAARDAAARDAAARDTTPETTARHDAATPAAVPAGNRTTFREEVLEREEERFGGIKVGSAFFGWLAAVGTGVLLTGLAAGLLTLFGLEVGFNNAADAAAENADTVALVAAITLIVVMFVAYYCGGYVAGRMARFDGAKQGLMVFVWALIIAVVVAIIAAVTGDAFNLLSGIQSVPSLPLGEADVTVASIVTAIILALAMLGGAVLGGIAGMRFHRRVDREGLGR
ncbi:hypothetical protein OH146_10785 [Salinibacterium sp. SYSU T00001]|uniref:hypothetical protein n=1 Tax=Homoserinimonas sedimenticola TaxID=2986805 RepID=UPI002236645E|nr:hypothetical protein [Salinibacterium sedimenticola]MCW4386257.1 hypothetical protein [Salinibacterium sedimenticola]